MAESKQLAGLIGPSLVAITISEAINIHIFASNIAPVVYLNGALLFVAGLSILRAHNLWAAGWPIVVTITGWAGILGGLFRMFFPETHQGGADLPTYAVIAFAFAIGSFLTFKAYGR